MGKMKMGWSFEPEHGFSGSCGVTHVKGYARGGYVKGKCTVANAQNYARGGTVKHKATRVIPEHPRPPHREDNTHDVGHVAGEKGNKGHPIGNLKQFAYAKGGHHKRHRADGGYVESTEPSDEAKVSSGYREEKEHEDARGGHVRKAGGGRINGHQGYAYGGAARPRPMGDPRVPVMRMKRLMPRNPAALATRRPGIGTPPMGGIGGPGGSAPSVLKRGGRAK